MWNSVIAAVICQMIYLNRIRHSRDLTFDIWPVTLCMQIVQCLSILTSSLVYLKPFLDSLETGFIQVGDLRRRHVPGFGYRPEEASSPKEPKLGLSFSSMRSKLSRSQPRIEDTELQDIARADVQSPRDNANSDAEHHDWDANSRSRILRTMTFSIERHRSGDASPSANSTHSFQGPK